MQNVVIAPSVEFVEVFQTSNGSVFQSDKENCWYIDFAGKLARFDYRSMMKLRKAVYAIPLEAPVTYHTFFSLPMIVDLILKISASIDP